MDEDWLERAEKIADEQLGKPPRDALEKMLPVAIIAAIGGVVAGTVIRGDADFGGAWAGIIVGARRVVGKMRLDRRPLLI